MTLQIEPHSEAGAYERRSIGYRGACGYVEGLWQSVTLARTFTRGFYNMSYSTDLYQILIFEI